jgi:hypothetical protein
MVLKVTVLKDSFFDIIRLTCVLDTAVKSIQIIKIKLLNLSTKG